MSIKKLQAALKKIEKDKKNKCPVCGEKLCYINECNRFIHACPFPTSLVPDYSGPS
jgi:hypothetical protein